MASAAEGSSSGCSVWGKLVDVKAGTSTFDSVLINKPKFVIGRAKDCDYQLGAKMVSAHHCYLERTEDGQIWLYDTSTNGTFINRDCHVRKNKGAELHHNDLVHLVLHKRMSNIDVYFKFQQLDETDSAKVDLESTQEYALDATLNWSSVDSNEPQTKKAKLESSPNEKSHSSAKKVVKTETNVPKASPVSCDLNIGASETVKTQTTTSPTKSKSDESGIGEALQCSLCLEIMYRPVCLQPCMHSYCASCYSQSMKRCKDCPQCRGVVHRVAYNPLLNNLVSAFLKDNPDKERSEEDIKLIEEQNKIPKEGLEFKKEDHFNNSQDSYYSDDDDTNLYDDSEDEEFVNIAAAMFTSGAAGVPFSYANYAAGTSRCRQCPGYISPASAAILQHVFDNTSQAGPSEGSVVQPFVCTPNQNHVMCRCCIQPMPDRRNAATNPPAPPQQCTVCSMAFCNMYWKCSKVGCKGCLNKFKDMVFEDNCLDQIFTNNTVESEIFKNHLLSKNKTWKDVLNECLAKLDSGEYACTVQLTSDTVVCQKCALRNFSTLAYFYRRDIPRDELSDAVKMRPDCHWGKNCRTQTHNAHHAQRFNHICEQTRF